ncbi:hypothetical protein AM592_03630 [Bacillus gobiensis]|uniref:Uncharacterized protein n=1 Tax=Bacillus gobiensis TaxID=1441095 RepID=A0A0M3R942_9BACI|nr:hypothetical protein AM592_03630 [Bacillus gobiensis]
MLRLGSFYFTVSCKYPKMLPFLPDNFPVSAVLKYNITNYSNIKVGVPFIAKEFGVTKNSRKNARTFFDEKLNKKKFDEMFQDFMPPKKTPPYSAETRAILLKLYLQLKRKVWIVMIKQRVYQEYVNEKLVSY